MGEREGGREREGGGRRCPCARSSSCDAAIVMTAGNQWGRATQIGSLSLESQRTRVCPHALQQQAKRTCALLLLGILWCCV